MSAGDVDVEGVQILSTEGMIRRPALSDKSEFIVATEIGILHRLRRENPTKTFYPASEKAACAYMKVTTLPKVLRALEPAQLTLLSRGGTAELRHISVYPVRLPEVGAHLAAGVVYGRMCESVDWFEGRMHLEE